MRKLIGTVVVILIIIVGFTGVDLRVNGVGMRIPPYIKNVINDEKKIDEAKEIFDSAKDKLKNEK